VVILLQLTLREELGVLLEGRLGLLGASYRLGGSGVVADDQFGQALGDLYEVDLAVLLPVLEVEAEAVAEDLVDHTVEHENNVLPAALLVLLAGEGEEEVLVVLEVDAGLLAELRPLGQLLVLSTLSLAGGLDATLIEVVSVL